MISTSQRQSSATQPESKPVHPLARFVTSEAIALLLEIEVSEIKDIRCWPNVILVVAEHLSRFVSYADLPPILEVEPPKNQDYITWRKRWKKNENKEAPKFWVQFYSQKFRQSLCFRELYTWGQMVGVIKFALSEESLELLRSVFREVWRGIYSRLMVKVS